MKLDCLLVTGDSSFLRRHARLLDALAGCGPRVETLAVDERSLGERLEFALAQAAFVARYLAAARLSPATRFDARAMRRAFNKSRSTFALKSRQISARIAARTSRPDLVLHIFGLCSPCDGPADVPYAHYLDYTRALARRNDRSEVPDAFAKDASGWIELERRAYQGALRLFTMSQLVRRSLIDDYGISPDRIEVVGAGVNFESARDGKTFGSKRLLFNASEFTRKGGDLVLAAWPLILRAEPAAKLVTVGSQLPRRLVGVDDRGRVSPAELSALFRDTDVVLAPALADPFPGFVIEAMNAGVPALVSERDAMPEIVTDGVDGVVLKAQTPERLATEVLALLRDPARLARISDAGRETVRSRLNWDRVANAMIESLRRA